MDNSELSSFISNSTRLNPLIDPKNEADTLLIDIQVSQSNDRIPHKILNLTSTYSDINTAKKIILDFRKVITLKSYTSILDQVKQHSNITIRISDTLFLDNSLELHNLFYEIDSSCKIEHSILIYITQTNITFKNPINKYVYLTKRLFLRKYTIDQFSRTAQRFLNKEGSLIIFRYKKDNNNNLEHLHPCNSSIISENKLFQINGLKKVIKEASNNNFILLYTRQPATQQLLPTVKKCFDKYYSNSNDSDNIILNEYIISRKDKILLDIKLYNRDYIVKLSLTNKGKKSIENNFNVLYSISNKNYNNLIVPKSYYLETIGNNLYSCEDKIEGTPVIKYIQNNIKFNFISKVQNAFFELHTANKTKLKSLNGKIYDTLVTTHLNKLFKFLKHDTPSKYIEDFFHKELFNQMVPIGTVHGDWSASNTFITKDESIALIDWETSHLNDIVLIDAIHFIDSLTRIAMNGAPPCTTIPITSNLSNLPSKHKLFLNECYKHFETDPMLHKGLVYLKWLRNISHLIDFWPTNKSNTYDNYIRNVLASIQ